MSAPQVPHIRDRFTPELAVVAREGYGARDLRIDAIAGLTVAIVALPLSMAIAIASGASPAQGLVTAIVGGFLVSALGGSRHQIGGPAGAFIPLVATTIAVHGMDGLIIATFMAGLMLVVVGLSRVGAYIKYIPYPVMVGFTAGIATIIFVSQIRDFLGLVLARPEPPALLDKLPALWAGLPTVQPTTLALSLATVGLIVALRRLRPRWPGFLIAVAITSLTAYILPLQVETIGSRFGELPTGIALSGLPPITLTRLRELMVPAIAIALLGGIESLLSAMVADGMSGRRHRSDPELVAQGLANMASALFGGLPVTGTIARTATNVRSGARSPVSGMLHALFVLAMLTFAGPLLVAVPLAALAAILVVVAANMAERAEFIALARASRGDAVVLFATFFLTIFVDLAIGIMVGIVLGALLFMHRMAEVVEVDVGASLHERDGGDPKLPQPTSEDVIVFRLAGAFFFGAAATAGAVFERIGAHPKTLVLDLTEARFLDSTGAHLLQGFVTRQTARGARVIVAGARPAVAKALAHFGVEAPLVTIAADRDEALRMSRASAVPQGNSAT